MFPMFPTITSIAVLVSGPCRAGPVVKLSCHPPGAAIEMFATEAQRAQRRLGREELRILDPNTLLSQRKNPSGFNLRRWGPPGKVDARNGLSRA
jgi:hypothetical protein